MNEEEKVKKQLLKNMFLNLLTFSIIFYMFGTVIYSQFYNSLYISADSELQKVIDMQEKFNQDDIKGPAPKSDESIGEKAPEEDKNAEIKNDENKVEDNKEFSLDNPRLISIQRDSDGNIISNSMQNSSTVELFEDIDFDENNLNTIYEINVGGNYSYRCVNYKINDETYMQVLINVDSEKDIAEQFKKTLVIAIVICIILILVASYILSKRTLRPIIISWKKQNKFVQDASHELRTPLAIIRAKQETLLEKPESKIIDNAEDISTTLKETQRLTKLINELMDLARNDSNQMKLNKEKFNLDKEIGTIVNLYKDVAKTQNKKLELKLNYNDIVYADANKIKQLLIILLDNSLKYTEPKDSIEIKTYKKDNKCVMEVADTGIGISKEDQEHIFERFYRAEKSRAREKGGMGLGLSIAYNIVKLHKGTIKVDKNVKKGTRMVVKIPVK